jgi:hypothetical protein
LGRDGLSQRGVADMAEEQPVIGPIGTQIFNDGRHTTVKFRDTDVVKVIE